MARGDTVETAQIAATTTAKAATFDGGCNKFLIRADADCYIDFDEVAVTSRSMLIKAAIDHPTEFNFGKNVVKKVWAITASSTANVYIVGIRE